MESFWEFFIDLGGTVGKAIFYLVVFRAAAFILGLDLFVPFVDPAIAWVYHFLLEAGADFSEFISR